MSSPPPARQRPGDFGIRIGTLPPGPTDSIVDVANVREAGPTAGGVVGAGTGMICYELKGGIGTASRVVQPIDRRALRATGRLAS